MVLLNEFNGSSENLSALIVTEYRCFQLPNSKKSPVKFDPFLCIALVRGRNKEEKFCPNVDWWEEAEGTYDFNSGRFFHDGARGLDNRHLEEG